MSNLPVLIIGGGVGGLTLAQGLRKAGVRFLVFERDPSPTHRAQGYRIRLSEGASALRASLTDTHWELFEATCATTKLGFAGFNAETGDALPPGGGGPPPRPGSLGPYTVDRSILRQVLMKGIEPNVRFGKAFDRLETLPTGVIRAHFRDGEIVEGAFLIAADGSRSAIRQQLLKDHTRLDTDLRCIYGKTYLTPAFEAQFPSGALQKITVIKDATPLTLFLEPVRFTPTFATAHGGEFSDVKDYVYWVLGSRQSTFGLPDEKFLALSSEEIHSLVLRLTSHWSGTFRSLFELQAQSLAHPLRMTSAPPIIPSWTPFPSVTFLGDAIHPMSPTGGSGANTALQDVEQLCKLFAGGQMPTAEQVGKYEEEMRARAGPMIGKSFQGARHIMGGKLAEECDVVVE